MFNSASTAINLGFYTEDSTVLVNRVSEGPEGIFTSYIVKMELKSFILVITTLAVLILVTTVEGEINTHDI